MRYKENLAKPRFKTSYMNFWTQLETKSLTPETIKKTLIKKFGEPTNQLSSNCLTELTKKITSYYLEDIPKNYTTYTLIGSLTSISDILERKFREGKRLGQTYYILKVGQEKLQASQEELEPSKWEQIINLSLIGKKLVFKYRKFYTNKQLLDFYEVEKDGEQSPRKFGEAPNGRGTD